MVGTEAESESERPIETAVKGKHALSSHRHRNDRAKRPQLNKNVDVAETLYIKGQSQPKTPTFFLVAFGTEKKSDGVEMKAAFAFSLTASPASASMVGCEYQYWFMSPFSLFRRRNLLRLVAFVDAMVTGR